MILSKYKLETNFIIYLFGKIISAGAIILSIPIFIKIFGVEEYGNFVFLYTIFLMVFSGFSGWINQGILRFYTLENNHKRMNKEIEQMSLISFILASVLLSFIFYFYNESNLTLILGVLCLYFSISYSTNLTIQQSLLKSKRFIKGDIIRALTFIIVPVILYHILPENYNPTNILFFGVLSSYFIGGIYFSKFNFIKIKVKLDKTRWSSIFLKYGIPLAFWVIFSPTTNGVDRIIIEYSLGAVAVAKFSAIFDIVFKLFSSLSVPFNNIVQPLLIKSYNEKNTQEYINTMKKAVIYLTSMFIIFLVGIMLFKEFILCNYLGFCSDVNSLSKLVFPLTLSSYFWQLSVLLQKNIEVTNRTVYIASYMLIVVILMTIFGLFYVPKYGLIGSAYISLTCASIYLAFIIYDTKKYFKI